MTADQQVKVVGAFLLDHLHHPEQKISEMKQLLMNLMNLLDFTDAARDLSWLPALHRTDNKVQLLTSRAPPPPPH